MPSSAAFSTILCSSRRQAIPPSVISTMKCLATFFLLITMPTARPMASLPRSGRRAGGDRAQHRDQVPVRQAPGDLGHALQPCRGQAGQRPRQRLHHGLRPGRQVGHGPVLDLAAFPAAFPQQHRRRGAPVRHPGAEREQNQLTVCEDARTLATTGGLFCSVPAGGRAVQRKPSSASRRHLAGGQHALECE
jgi:hypothetical protein